MQRKNKSFLIADYLKTVILSGFPGVEDLAALHYVSVSKMMRDFKRTFKISPYVYFRRLQMEFAEEHMRNTHCNKKQIAFMLGFSNPGNYSSCYNRYLNHKGIKKHQAQRIENATLPVAMLDKNQDYLLVSKELLKACNLTDVNVIGKNFFDIFSEISSGFDDLKCRLLKTGAESRIENYDFYNNGNLFKGSVKPWYDDTGQHGGVIIYVKSL